MKKYPSIKQSIKEFSAYIFDKLDGSNLRFAWSKNQGWYEWGSRYRPLFDSHVIFGQAKQMFMEKYSEPMEKIAMDHNWKQMNVFIEFWGNNSLGGKHDPDDVKNLTLIDVAVNNAGLLGPEKFLELFHEFDTPKFFGKMIWNAEFVERVRLNQLEGITFEGVVGKTGHGHKIKMAKAKTQAWKDVIIEKNGREEGLKIINS